MAERLTRPVRTGISLLRTFAQGISSVGRAPPLQGGCHRFESGIPYHFSAKSAPNEKGPLVFTTDLFAFLVFGTDFYQNETIRVLSFIQASCGTSKLGAYYCSEPDFSILKLIYIS